MRRSRRLNSHTRREALGHGGGKRSVREEIVGDYLTYPHIQDVNDPYVSRSRARRTVPLLH
jgi:hypothetical protein